MATEQEIKAYNEQFRHYKDKHTVAFLVKTAPGFYRYIITSINNIKSVEIQYHKDSSTIESTQKNMIRKFMVYTCIPYASQGEIYEDTFDKLREILTGGEGPKI